jgi:hypothetical protein
LSGDKLLSFLQAVIDDSTSHIGDRRLFMAGYLNRAANWTLFAAAWNEELRTKPSINYLKMVEAQNRRDQFKGWCTQDRDEKLRALARVIRHFKPLSFHFSLSRATFDQVLGPVTPYGLNAHYTCISFVVAKLVDFAATRRGNIPIDFIFDQQEGVNNDIHLLFDGFKNSLPKKSQRLINGAPIFRDDKQFAPLQAADMLAWHLRREHEISPNGFPKTQLSMTENILSEYHLCADIPDTLMKEWADHHRQLPGISLVQSKTQWRNTKREISDLIKRGIDPSKIKGPGIYYPEGTPMLVRVIDTVRRMIWRIFHS